MEDKLPQIANLVRGKEMYIRVGENPSFPTIR